MEMVLMKTIKKYNLFENDSTIIVAVSGGADSMALLHFLVKIIPKFNLRLIVAHVNHKKRKAADLDEALVKEIAEQYELIYEIYDLPQHENLENFHEYARSKRYEFFKSLAKTYAASCIVTAHHADDHLETLLHRLLYYNTASSLIGIEPVNWQDEFKIVRPFIEVTKEEVYKYCHDMKVKFREDESNESDTYTRNRIRKNIVSTLVKESPTIHTHARIISEQISEDERYFSVEIDKLMNQVIKKNEVYEISRDLLKELPKSLSRRLLKRILQVFNYKDITSSHIEDLLKLISSSKPNLEMKLPHGVTCVIAYNVVQFSTLVLDVSPYEYELRFNGQVTLPTEATINVKYGKGTQKTENSCIICAIMK